MLMDSLFLHLFAIFILLSEYFYSFNFSYNHEFYSQRLLHAGINRTYKIKVFVYKQSFVFENESRTEKHLILCFLHVVGLDER